MPKLINITVDENPELMLNANTFNTELKNIQSAIVREALDHFKSTGVVRNRKKEDEERYFYNTSELQMFLSLCKNPYVKYKEEKDSYGVIYTVYREIPEEKKKIGKYRKTKEKEARTMLEALTISMSY